MSIQSSASVNKAGGGNKRRVFTMKRPNSTQSKKMIHPIIIYPFSHPKDTRHIVALYDSLIKDLSNQPDRYHRPVTVLNRQTFTRNRTTKGFQELLDNRIKNVSTVLNTWSVDTCQMWLAGLGSCFDRTDSGPGDVFWLIPGDFNYASKSGKNVLSKLLEIPSKVYEDDCELCLGEIDASPNSSKQLIDTYGTYGLLYNWFPTEAQRIRKTTDKPRTEFFAINHAYLDFVLRRRWYAYEQMIVILLQGMAGPRPTRDIRRVPLGMISDEEQGRDSLASAMQQVERTERVLKLFWRETWEGREGWPDIFRKLDAQSEQVRGAALVIFERVLRLD